MNKNNVYKELEKKLVKYTDLIAIQAIENYDGFVSLPSSSTTEYGAIGRYETLGDMKESFPLIPVRSEVKEKLDNADRALKEIDANLQLVVAYGYRSLEIQQKYFDEQKKTFLEKGIPEGENIDEVIHRLIAVPTVAGHPTGGAVDVFIEDRRDGKKLDFGVPIFTFDSKDTYSFSPFISDQAQQNRKLLRQIMMFEDFAPYDGEWWHFSYGDKEWAFYYQRPCALYQQKAEIIVAGSLRQQFNNKLSSTAKVDYSVVTQ